MSSRANKRLGKWPELAGPVIVVLRAGGEDPLCVWIRGCVSHLCPVPSECPAGSCCCCTLLLLLLLWAWSRASLSHRAEVRAELSALQLWNASLVLQLHKPGARRPWKYHTNWSVSQHLLLYCISCLNMEACITQTNNKTKRIKTIKQKQPKQATNRRRKPQSNFLLQDILNFLSFFVLIFVIVEGNFLGSVFYYRLCKNTNLNILCDNLCYFQNHNFTSKIGVIAWNLRWRQSCSNTSGQLIKTVDTKSWLRQFSHFVEGKIHSICSF